jgi:hypothetical protein
MEHGHRRHGYCIGRQSLVPSFLVSLIATRVVSPSGLPLVPLLGKVATDTGVSVCHPVTMSPAVVVWGRVESTFFLQKSFSVL